MGVTVTYEFGRWVCLCDYEDSHFPKAAGFYWDSRRRAWVTSKADRASGLMMYADPDAKKRILNRLYGSGHGSDSTMFTPAKSGRFGNHAS